MSDTKTCSKCGEIKAITEFYTTHNKYWCKLCVNSYNREHYAKNADKIKAQHLDYYSDKREYINARQQTYYANHAEEVKAREARYKIEHADKVKARELKYRQSNPDRVRASQKRKFKKRIANDPDFVKSRIARLGIITLKPELMLRDNNACVLCSSSCNLHCHHIVPVMEDAQLLLEPSNLVILCKTCHYKAHNNGRWTTINPELAIMLQTYIATLT
jgi:5-methylcytosine-specific restriction endonuclease McrA